LSYIIGYRSSIVNRRYSSER